MLWNLARSRPPIDLSNETKSQLLNELRAVGQVGLGQPVLVASNILTAAVTIGIGEPSDIAMLATICTKKIGQFSEYPKLLARTCWALGATCYADRNFWRAVGVFVENHGTSMELKWLATIADAAAYARVRDPALFGSLARHFLERPEEIDRRVEVKMRRAFNKIDLTDRSTLNHIVGKQLPPLRSCGPADRELILKVLNKLHVRRSSLVERLAGELTGELPTKSIRDLARETRELLALRPRASWYFDALSRNVRERIDQCRAGDLVVFAQAFTANPRPGNEALGAIASRAVQLGQKNQLSLGNCIDLLEAFSAVEFADPAFLGYAASRLAEAHSHLKTPDLARSAVAFARLRESADGFFSVLTSELTRRHTLEPFDTHLFAEFAWSYAEVRHDLEPMFSIGADSVIARARGSSPGDLARLTYSALVLNENRAHSLFDLAVATCESRISETSPISAIYLFWSAKVLGRDLPSALAKRAEILIVPDESKSSPMNGFERQVLEILGRIGVNAHPQVPESGYVIDFVVEAEGQKWAIECDGSRYHQVDRHFTGKLLGHHVVRDKVLARQGYQTLRISGEEADFATELEEALRKRLAS